MLWTTIIQDFYCKGLSDGLSMVTMMVETKKQCVNYYWSKKYVLFLDAFTPVRCNYHSIHLLELTSTSVLLVEITYETLFCLTPCRRLNTLSILIVRLIRHRWSLLLRECCCWGLDNFLFPLFWITPTAFIFTLVSTSADSAYVCVYVRGGGGG